MALTIAIDGKGVIANCDAETPALDTGGTGTGIWSEQGGGSMSVNAEVFLYGTSSIGGQYASKSGFQQFDLGAGNELDFDVAGTEEGQFIYMWVNMTAFGTLDTLANTGLAIRISSDTPGITNYKDFTIAGSDGANGWTGGWKLFVIDPTKTASRVNGACDIGAIRTLGIWIDCAKSVRAESIFIDQIAVGTGLSIEGTSVVGWKDVMDYCTDYPNRAWGMMQERDGVYYAFGKFTIGDTAQGAAVSFKDSGRVIQFGTSQYYQGAAWKTTFPTTGCGIVVEDIAAHTTIFEDGVIVGADNGRSGTVFIGNADQNVTFDLYGGSNADSTTKLYGTIFKVMKGTLVMGNDADHLMYGCTFAQCGQFDPVGAPKIRNCTFAETTHADSALLWNENIDINDCKFIANTTGAGIEMPSSVGTPYDYDDLIFSGNTKDVLNSSGNPITITKTGVSDPTTSEGAAVTFSGSVSITVTVKDTGGNLLADVQTAVYKTSDRTQLMNEDTVAGVATEAYTGATPVDVEVRCRKSSHPGTKYKNFSSLQTIAAGTGLTLSVTLEEDTYNNATN